MGKKTATIFSKVSEEEFLFYKNLSKEKNYDTISDFVRETLRKNAIKMPTKKGF